MPRNRDLFDDSTMTFGEHLEVLRVHVWRALLGMVIGVVLCLFVGHRIVEFLRTPIDQALERNNMPELKDDLGKGSFIDGIRDWWNRKEGATPAPDAPDPESLPNDELVVEVPIKDLSKALQSVSPDIQVVIPPEPEPVDPSDDGEKAKDADGESPDSIEAAPKTVPLVIKSPEFAMWRKLVQQSNRPVSLKVEEAFLTYIKVSMVAGFAMTSPWIFYQIWLFVAAGLYSHERKYVYTYLPMSLGLFLVGGAFCYYFVLPIVLDFLLSFNSWLGIQLTPRLSEYISFVLILPVLFGVSFQLPMVMLFLERIGIMTVAGYIENWRMAVLIISIASMLLTPSDPSSMLMMMFPLIILYIGGIQLCRFNPSKSADPLA